MASKSVFLLLGWLLGPALTWGQPTRPTVLDSLIKANSHSLQLTDGQLQGQALPLLAQEARRSQFFVLGEEHNHQQLSPFSAALFRALQPAGFQYFACENDPLTLQTLSSTGYRGRRDSAQAWARRYPLGYTFITDQELEMLADIGGASRAKGHALWGCDQAFGATHYLRRLLPLAPDRAARACTERLLSEVYAKERSREEPHFMATPDKPADFFQLRALYHPKANSEADFLIQALEKSDEIYRYYTRATQGEVTSLLNNAVREAYLKERFLQEYRLAQRKGDQLPRVLLKFGGFHAMRGLGLGGVYTTGNFCHEFAISNGLQSFALYVQPIGPAGTRYDIAQDWLKPYLPFIRNVDPAAWTLIDLRPLRAYAHQGRLRNALTPEQLGQFVKFLYTWDAILIMGNSSKGTYTVYESSQATQH